MGFLFSASTKRGKPTAKEENKRIFWQKNHLLPTLPLKMDCHDALTLLSQRLTIWSVATKDIRSQNFFAMLKTEI